MNIMSLEQVRDFAKLYQNATLYPDESVLTLCATVKELAEALRWARNRMAKARDAASNGEEDVARAHLDYGKAEIDDLLARLDVKVKP